LNNYFAPKRPLGTYVRDINDVLYNFDTVLQYTDDQGGQFYSQSARENLYEYDFFVNSSTPSAYSWIHKDGTTDDGTGAAPAGAIHQVWLDPTEHNRPGKNLGAGLRVSCAGNSVAVANNSSASIQWNGVFWGNNLGKLIPFLGSVVLAAGANAGSWDDERSGFPNAGQYAPIVWLFSPLPAGACMSINVQLYKFYT
jgi:hypothetical protein